MLSAITEPALRSIPPLMMISVMPTAPSPTMTDCEAMVWTLFQARKSVPWNLAAMVKNTTSNTRLNAIPRVRNFPASLRPMLLPGARVIVRPPQEWRGA